jgi:nuclear transport factor 2 (NTF2) superfamily protein
MKTLIKKGLTGSGKRSVIKSLFIISSLALFMSFHTVAKAQDDNIVPPFTQESAQAKLKTNESAWNTHDPEKIAMLYGPDAEWREGTSMIKGRAAIIAYLKEKFAKETDFKTSKEVWGAKLSKNAIRFEDEWLDAKTGQWYHSYGVEVVLFDDKGIIIERYASINDKPINASERSIK